MSATLYRLLRERVAQGASPEDAADQALRAIRKVDLVAFVRPLVVWQARRYARSDVRRLEREVERRIAKGEDPISVRRKLSQSEFALPDGSFVSWGQATPEQHRARAGWQRQLAGACAEDAQHHDQVADLLDAAGAVCLDDLEEAA